MLRSTFKTLFVTLILTLTFYSTPERAGAQTPLHSATEPAEIRGQVRYAPGNAPAANVLVRLEAMSGGYVGEERTDNIGKFRFTGLNPIQYFVYIRQPGFKEIQHEVNLVMVASDYIQLQLVPDVSPSRRASTYAPAKLVDANVPAEARKEFESAEAALAGDKRLDDGIRHLEKAIELYPKFLEAELRLGAAYMDLRQWDKAEQALRRALEINPKTANAYFAIGEIYLQQRKYDEAEKALRQGLGIENHSWQGHFTLARVYWGKSDIVQAGRQVALTIQLNPNFAEAHLLAGNILARAGKREDALMEFQEYLRLAPKGEYATQAREMIQKLKQPANK